MQVLLHCESDVINVTRRLNDSRFSERNEKLKREFFDYSEYSQLYRIVFWVASSSGLPPPSIAYRMLVLCTASDGGGRPGDEASS